jgi:hypothetical protein
VQEAIDLFEASAVGRQLAEPSERNGHCWRAATRFLPVLRELGADGEMVVWSGEGWERGAIQLKGTDIVVDWTPSQLEKDADKARAVDFPCIRTRADRRRHKTTDGRRARACRGDSPRDRADPEPRRRRRRMEGRQTRGRVVPPRRRAPRVVGGTVAAVPVAVDGEDLEATARRAIELAIDARQRELEGMAFELVDGGRSGAGVMSLTYEAA